MKTTFDNERQFAQKLSNIFLKLNSVKVKQSNNLAWAEVKNKELGFNFPKIFKGMDIFKEMMTFKGLLFHEIHHLKHTVNSKQYRYLPMRIKRLVQVLEDGRIETLGVLKYEKLADYFIFSVNNVLLEEKEAILNNHNNEIVNIYLLCYGRKIFWLDMKLLEKMREIMVTIYGHDIVSKVEQLIDEYQFEVSSNKRIKIAETIYQLLATAKANPDYNDGKGNNTQLDTGRGDPKTMSMDLKQLGDLLKKAKVVSIQIRKDLKDKTKDTKDQSQARLDSMAKAKEDIDNLKVKLDKTRDQMRSSKTDKTYEKKLKETNDIINEIEIKQDDVGSGAGFSPEGSMNLQLELGDMIDNKDDEQDELVDKNEQDLLQDLKSSGHSLDNVYADSSFDVTEDMELQSRELEKALKKLNTEMVKGYVGKQKSGRLNIKSFLNRKDRTDFRIFKKYMPDKIRETKILLNIYLDGSGSMNGEERWGKALKSMWVINDALNKDQNKVLAYQFSGGFEKFKDYDKPLTIPKMMGGGTYPSGAIKDSIPKIEKYKRTHSYSNVIDIIITDGEFDVGGKSDKQIGILNKLGHETILINISDEGRYVYRGTTSSHGAKHFIKLKYFEELVPELLTIFTKVKKALIKKVKVM